jgi:signal transduction histidine kinase
MASPEFDAVEAFNVLIDIAEDIGRGSPPRQILAKTLEITQRFTGADAACFVTVEPNAARVVGTTPGAAWLDGRYFPFKGSALAALLAGPDRSRMFDQADTAPGIQWDLTGHGLQKVALARVSGVRTLGALAAFFADPNATLTGAARRMFEYSAVATGTLAWLRPDPVPHQFGVVAAAVPDGLAVLDPDGVIRSWNPAAHRLTGLSPTRAIGEPPPFAVPEPGQLLEIQLDSGRWLEVRSSTLGTTEPLVITFRDVTAPRMEEEGRDLFLATTSHELRTPLTVVKGYADTLANRWDDLDDDARRTAVRAIRERTGQLAALVDRLLLANRSESGAVAMERSPFDLRAAGATAVRAAPSNQNRCRPVFDAPEQLPWARGDRGSIATIVNELLTNADKYSPAGGEVRVTAGSDASSVFFQVADRGIGVAPEHVDAVFDRFWQAEQGDQRRFGGVGLGLYIIRRLLDRQGGWVALRPREGGGTVVEVRLPRVAADPADGDSGPRAPASTEYPRSGQAEVASQGDHE